MSKIYVMMELGNLDNRLITAYNSENECMAEVARRNFEYYSQKKKMLKALGYYSDKEIEEHLSYANDLYFYEEVELK